MTTYNINIQEPHFSYIKSGVKKYEIRLNRSKFAEMKMGDNLIVNDVLQLKIVDIKKYKSFEEALTNLGIKNILPNKENMVDALKVYEQFYTKEDEQNFGVLSFEIEVI